MKQLFSSVFGMFLGVDGKVSSSKLMSLLGFFVFLVISCVVLCITPDKFDYVMFSSVVLAYSASLSVVNKVVNVLYAAVDSKGKANK